MSLTDVLILAFGGLAAGVINTMAGGGSTITVPLLVFAGVPGTYANGSNRVGILPACLAAVLSFRRLGVSGFRDSRVIFLPVIFGSLVGSVLINQVGDDQFERLFAFLVIPIVILTLMPQKSKPKERESSWSSSTMILIFFVVGIYGGAIQAGVGLLMVLTLSRSGFDLVVANSIKVMINALVTVIALPVFIFSGKISWGPALVLAAGLTVGGWLGAKLSLIHISEPTRPY